MPTSVELSRDPGALAVRGPQPGSHRVEGPGPELCVGLEAAAPGGSRTPSRSSLQRWGASRQLSGASQVRLVELTVAGRPTPNLPSGAVLSSVLNTKLNELKTKNTLATRASLSGRARACAPGCPAATLPAHRHRNTLAANSQTSLRTTGDSSCSADCFRKAKINRFVTLHALPSLGGGGWGGLRPDKRIEGTDVQAPSSPPSGGRLGCHLEVTATRGSPREGRAREVNNGAQPAPHPQAGPRPGCPSRPA